MTLAGALPTGRSTTPGLAGQHGLLGVGQFGLDTAGSRGLLVFGRVGSHTWTPKSVSPEETRIPVVAVREKVIKNGNGMEAGPQQAWIFVRLNSAVPLGQRPVYSKISVPMPHTLTKSRQICEPLTCSFFVLHRNSSSASMANVTRRASIATALRAAGCVFAEDEAQLLLDAAHYPDQLNRMVDQRLNGRPLEHIVGWAEFCGTRISVDPGVFVPRRRTEFVVRVAAMIAKPGAVVVDLCCGSGAIGAALNDLLGSCKLHAADIDPAAVQCARRNVEPRGGRVHQGDLYAALPRELRGKVDVLLANAPYVPTESMVLMPQEARLHEPRVALDGGADGLDVQRRLALGAAEWLAPGGSLVMETSSQQAPRTARLLQEAGLLTKVASDEELDATVVLAAHG